MYCPSCGTQAIDVTRFCRVCGANLHAVSKVLNDQPGQELEPIASSPEKQNADRKKMMRLGFIVLWAGIILGCLLAAVGDAVSSVNRGAGDLISGLGAVGAIVMMVGVGVMIYSRFLPKADLPAGRQEAKALPAPPQVIQSTPTNRNLDQVPSVTEHTTYKLETPAEKSGTR